MRLSQGPLSLGKVKPVPKGGLFEQPIFINQPVMLQSTNVHFPLPSFFFLESGEGGSGERSSQPKHLNWSVEKKSEL